MKYAQKSSAVRAATKQGLTKDTMVLIENKDGTWSFSTVDAVNDALVRVSTARAAQTADDAFQATVAKRKATVTSSISEQIAAAQADDGADDEDVRPRFLKETPAEEPAPTLPARKRRDAIEKVVAEAKFEGEKAASKRKTTDRPDGLRVGSKAAILVDLVARPEGATYQELLDATGWGECRPRLKEACAKAGLTLELRKAEAKGEPSRYFATR